MKSIYILLATYNGEKYLKEQLDSLFNQTYQNWTLWIHDDNSEDNTVNIIKKYMNIHPNRIVFLDDEISTGGAKENFTYLLNHIDNNFNYVMFCDQDDVWLDNRIELFCKKMISSEYNFHDKPIVIFSDLIVVNENLNIISDSMAKSQKLNPVISQTPHSLKCQNVITGCAMMMNKKALRCSLPIPKSALMHDWWIGLVVSKLGKNIFLNQTTILYRQHSNNQVGFKKLDISYILRVVFSKKIYRDYINSKKMMQELEIKISFFSFLICKIKVIFLRYFKC